MALIVEDDERSPRTNAAIERTTYRIERDDAPALHVTRHQPKVASAPWTLLLVHGTAGHGACYDGFAANAAARGIDVHSLDLRGHGRSEGERGVFTMPDFLGDVDAFAAHVARAVTHPLVLLGASQGGEIAFHSLASSKAVSAAVCMNVLLSTERPMNRRIALMQSPVVGAFASVFGDRLRVPLRRVIDFEAAYKEDPDLLRRKASDPLYVWSYGLRSYRSVFTYRPPRRAAENDKPVLVVVGEDDPIVGAAHCRSCFELIGGPKSIYTMPNAGHQLMEFHSERLLAALEQWVEHAVTRRRPEPMVFREARAGTLYADFVSDQRKRDTQEEPGYRLSLLDRALCKLANGNIATGVEFFRHAKKTDHGRFVSEVVQRIDEAAWPLFAPWLPDVTPGRVPAIAVLACGTGEIADELSRKKELAGWNVTGFEIDGEAVEEARRRFATSRVQFEVLDVRRLGEHARSCFDAIYIHGVFDHCAGHLEVLRACRDALRPGGVVMIVTPDRNWSTWLRFVAIGPRFVFGLGPWSKLHDYRRFSRPPELDALAREAGLATVADPDSAEGAPWRRGLDYAAGPIGILRAVRRRNVEGLEFEVTRPQGWLGGFRGEFITVFRNAAGG